MRNLLYLVIAFFITGCSCVSSEPKALEEAGRMLASDPGAALRRLNDIDISSFNDSATMARWALLYSEAMVANNITAPTDTIADIAIEYYGRHNRPDEYRRASRLKALLRREACGDELATALYLQKEREFTLYRERAERRLYATLGIALLLAAALAIVWLTMRLRLNAIRTRALIAEASDMKRMAETSAGNVERLEQSMHTLLAKRFSLIDSLCQTYYESQGTKTERKAIAERVKREIDATATEYFPEMEQTVNDCRSDLLLRLKNKYPAIKPDDYRLAVFLACGLTPRTISLLLDETVEVVYKRKSRLKGRLKTLAGDEDADIMEIF